MENYDFFRNLILQYEGTIEHELYEVASQNSFSRHFRHFAGKLLSQNSF